MTAKEKKTAKPKPQLKKIDDLFGLSGEEAQGKFKIQEIPISNLIPFEGHPFRLYEGERLEDIVESVKANGVLIPVIARKKAIGDSSASDEALEILAGHNRINAAKIAGLETVPAIVFEDISDDEAMVYVVETNLIQRSFADMTHSEKAAVIAMHHSKMFSQGKRNDILEQLRAIENPEFKIHELKTTDESEADTGIRTTEKIGAMYSLSRNTIARYLRISQLNGFLKSLLDNGTITFLVAVELSFLAEEEQEWLKLLNSVLGDKFAVNASKAGQLRKHSKDGTLDKITMKNIVSGNAAVTENKPQKVKIDGEVYSRYFKPEQSAKEIESIVEEALAMYFENGRG
jgi:ParB family chromosome partitioning protein